MFDEKTKGFWENFDYNDLPAIIRLFQATKGYKPKTLHKWVKWIPEHKAVFIHYSLMEMLEAQYRKVFPDVSDDDLIDVAIMASEMIYDLLSNPEKLASIKINRRGQVQGKPKPEYPLP